MTKLNAIFLIVIAGFIDLCKDTIGRGDEYAGVLRCLAEFNTGGFLILRHLRIKGTGSDRYRYTKCPEC